MDFTDTKWHIHVCNLYVLQSLYIKNTVLFHYNLRMVYHGQRRKRFCLLFLIHISFDVLITVFEKKVSNLINDFKQLLNKVL